MEPDEYEEDLDQEMGADPSDDTPPQGFPQVVATYEQSADDAHHDMSDGVDPINQGHIFDAEYQPDRTPPARPREFPFWAWLLVPVALVLGIIAVLVLRPVAHTPVATPQTPGQPSASSAQDGQSAPARTNLGDDTPLPLTTPAPPGKFQSVGLAMFSGPDDVQLNPGSVVLPDDRLTFRLSYNGAKLEDKVEVKWEVNDRDWGVEEVHLNPWTTSQWFIRKRPESGWPEGRYRLTVFHEDTEVSSIFFEVSATGQPLDPNTVTFPEQGEGEGQAQGGASEGVEGSTSESEFSFTGPSDASESSQ